MGRLKTRLYFMSEIFTDEQINEISNNIQKAVNEEINKQIENIMGEKEIILKKLEEIENRLPPTRFLSDYEKGSIEGKMDLIEDLKYFINFGMRNDPDRIIWTGDNLKEVIDFVGKAPWFDEWFKSWEEYEAYVKSHNNIFKIFSLSGHYEIYPGCEIQKLRAFESCVPITDKKYQYIINGLQQ
jgi:uncharacterized membrane protein YheB (UPF0754 family)